MVIVLRHLALAKWRKLKEKRQVLDTKNKKGKSKAILIFTMLRKLKTKDLSSQVLQTSDRSNLAKISSAKSSKALELLEQLVEPMLTHSRSVASKCEAPGWLKPSPASLVTSVCDEFGSSTLRVPLKTHLLEQKVKSPTFSFFLRH